MFLTQMYNLWSRHSGLFLTLRIKPKILEQRDLALLAHYKRQHLLRMPENVHLMFPCSEAELSALFKEFFRSLDKITCGKQSCLEKICPKVWKYWHESMKLRRNFSRHRAWSLCYIYIGCCCFYVSWVCGSITRLTWGNGVNKKRKIEEDRARNETKISLNGPEISQCKQVVKNAMTQCWREESK